MGYFPSFFNISPTFLSVTEKDIWNYLVENVWKSKENLELHELISDILYANNYDLNEYAMRNIKEYKDKEELVMDKEDLF